MLHNVGKIADDCGLNTKIDEFPFSKIDYKDVFDKSAEVADTEVKEQIKFGLFSDKTKIRAAIGVVMCIQTIHNRKTARVLNKNGYTFSPSKFGMGRVKPDEIGASAGLLSFDPAYSYNSTKVPYVIDITIPTQLSKICFPYDAEHLITISTKDNSPLGDKLVKFLKEYDLEFYIDDEPIYK